jgi:hypothetical protein
MRNRIAVVCAVFLAAGLECGWANADEVKVYRSAQLKPGEYETVARLWVETWRPRAWVPTYDSPEEGVDALRDKAAGLGANGIIDVGCYGDRGLFSGAERFLCYGKAIKVR